MSLASIRGVFTPLAINSEIVTDLSAFTRQVFINEFPLVARSTRREVGSPVFELISDDPRSRSYTLGANIAADDTGTITLSDVSALMPGDVLEIGTERVEVSGNPTISNESTGAGTVPVVRGVEGTTPANATSSDTTHTSGDPVVLVGNSRTGAEVDQEGYRTPRNFLQQFIQTFQFPVQVGGLANSLRNVRLPSGDTNVFSAEQKRRLIDMYRDMEYSSYYGIGEAPSEADTQRAKQKGIRTLVNTAGNLETNPTNGSAYKPTDLIRDVFQPVTDKGGRVDILLVSTDFQTGLARWGFGHLTTTPQTNAFGTPIEVLEVPFLGRAVNMIPCPLLKKGTAIGLTSEEVYWAYVRPESWKPRGSRGDAFEGDWLASGAIELENVRHHSMVENIAEFAAEYAGV